jgi:hypothetical protein
LLLSDSFHSLFPPSKQNLHDFHQLKIDTPPTSSSSSSSDSPISVPSKNRPKASDQALIRVLNEQTLTNYDSFPEGSTESGLLFSLEIFHCLSERIYNQGILEPLHDDLISIIEPTTPINLATDPLTQSIPASLSKNLLLSILPTLSALFGKNNNTNNNNNNQLHPQTSQSSPTAPPSLQNLDAFSQFDGEKLPIPMLLIGYENNWMEVSPVESIHYWEKTGLQPYAPPKNFSYFVVSINEMNHHSGANNSGYIQPSNILSSIDFFFRELSCIYEVCHLGTHHPFSSFSKYPNGIILQDSTSPNLPNHASLNSNNNNNHNNNNTNSNIENNNNNNNSAMNDLSSKAGKYYHKFKLYKRALTQLISDLSEQMFYADTSVVIYIVNPFSHSFVL